MTHQVETTKFLICNKRAYCFNQMGTGKTLSAAWAADFLMINDVIKKVLITAPLSTLRAAWGRDLLMNLPHRRWAICHGSRDYRIKVLRSDVDFVIINHDGVKVVEDEIVRQGFDIFIIDELTGFKTLSTERTRAAERIAHSVKGVWGMTGEPTPNGPLEAYGQARVVNPTNPFVPKFYGQFRDKVVEKAPWSDFVWLPKPGANDLVFRMLQPVIRFTREECVDLPPRTFETREVELTPEQVVVYEKMRKELLVEYQNGQITASNAGVKAMKLLQIAAGCVKDDEGERVYLACNNRLNDMYDIFESTPQKKLVIFSAFRAMVEKITEFFRAKGVKAEFIYGGTDQKARGRYIDEFQDGDLQVLVIQPQSASHGITLTAASTIIWHSLLASGEHYNQANDRITRIGQTRKQLVIHMVGCRAERHVLDILEGKGEQSADLMNTFGEFLKAA